MPVWESSCRNQELITERLRLQSKNQTKHNISRPVYSTSQAAFTSATTCPIGGLASWMRTVRSEFIYNHLMWFSLTGSANPGVSNLLNKGCVFNLIKQKPHLISPEQSDDLWFSDGSGVTSGWLGRNPAPTLDICGEDWTVPYNLEGPKKL